MDLLEKIFLKVVRTCTGIRDGEKCLLITDHRRSALRRALETAIQACGGILSIIEISPEAYDTSLGQIEKRMMAADVVYLLTRQIFPRRPRLAAVRAGARVLSLCKVDEPMALRALDVDYEELSRVTHRLAETLASGSEIYLNTPTGTDFRVKIKDQPIIVLDGKAREAGTISALPAGVVAVLPIPGTAEGKLVLDGSLDSIGLLDEPIVLTVAEGRVAEIRGGSFAKWLQRALARDENASCIAEFGMGTNPKAIYSGNLVEDERVRGSVHIGFGGNTHLGGTITSGVHLDATLKSPTVRVGSQMLVKEGILQL